MLTVRYYLTLTLAVTALAAVPGCSRSRWLSRRDYSELHDPFMDPTGSSASADASATAESGSETASESGGRFTGLARLGQPAASDDASGSEPAAKEGRSVTGGITSLFGPKPIKRASAALPPNGTTGSVTQATYPASADDPFSESGTTTLSNAGPAATATATAAASTNARGPSLSDFMQPPTESSSAASLDRPFSTPPAAAGVAAYTQPEPAVSQFPGLEQFAQERKTQAANATAAVTDDFASWASQQEQRATGIASQLGRSATTATDAAAAGFSSAAGSVNRAADSFNAAAVSMKNTASEFGSSVPSLAPSFDDESADRAEPLIRRPAAPAEAPVRTAAGTSTPGASQIPAVTVSGSNPFAAFDSSAAPAPATSAEPARSGRLDSGFQMDSGWKPSHFTRP